MNLRVKNKLVLGLTGSMLSGKSTALNFFAQHGAAVLSADEIVRELYRVPEVQQQLSAWFGSFQPARVAAAVFNNKAARRKLEGYLHPLVLKAVAKQIQQSANNFFVFEVPLLFESGWDKLTDLNILILGDKRTLSARLQERGVSLAEYNRRIAAQLPEDEKARRADIVLANCGSKTDLNLKIKRLIRAITFIYGVK